MNAPKVSHRYAQRVMAMVMAGGQGSRLHPLTDKRSKPTVPFGSRYRIVDFVLSNLIEKASRIGFDPEEDRRSYKVSPGGVVVVPRGRTPYFARSGRGFGPGYAE